MQHREQRHYALRCVCGYEADDAFDLEDHIVAAAAGEDEWADVDD